VESFGPETLNEKNRRLPPWFKISLATNERHGSVRSVLQRNGLHTVCQSAACPNRTECWNAGTATFLILGNRCTRNCRFCNVPKGAPSQADSAEPARVADSVAALGLHYAVVTSVTRDDLEDGGASLFAATIRAIRIKSPKCRVEVLIPDFQGSLAALETILNASPDVLGHNVETVPRLYPRVRPGAEYQRSLGLLRHAAEKGAVAKSGIMAGLGESTDELERVMSDLQDTGCSILTIGQYLQPGKGHLPVERFYHPDEFAGLKEKGLAIGFKAVVSGPLVRSSYHAADVAK
jgi:lipoic acid synthetase